MIVLTASRMFPAEAEPLTAKRSKRTQNQEAKFAFSMRPLRRFAADSVYFRTLVAADLHAYPLMGGDRSGRQGISACGDAGSW